jgi:hypothetical protein
MPPDIIIKRYWIFFLKKNTDALKRKLEVFLGKKYFQEVFLSPELKKKGYH